MSRQGLTGTRDNHKHLEKGSENAELETKSEEAKTSQIPVGPQKGQVMQVWFGRKKRSSRGKKEGKDNLIEAEQSQETPMKSVQSNSTEDTKDIKSFGDIEGIKDIEDVENIGDIEDMEDIENIEDVEDIEGLENIKDIKNFENTEGIDDIEVEKADDIEEMEGSEAMECTETGIQTGKPEIESQEPKNGKTLSCNAITLPKEFMATTWVQREEDAQRVVPLRR
jgi:hypothetical protein